MGQGNSLVPFAAPAAAMLLALPQCLFVFRTCRCHGVHLRPAGLCMACGLRLPQRPQHLLHRGLQLSRQRCRLTGRRGRRRRRQKEWRLGRGRPLSILLLLLLLLVRCLPLHSHSWSDDVVCSKHAGPVHAGRAVPAQTTSNTPWCTTTTHSPGRAASSRPCPAPPQPWSLGATRWPCSPALPSCRWVDA